MFDISSPESPELLVTITRVAGFNWGHTFTPTPDGRYAIAEAECSTNRFASSTSSWGWTQQPGASSSTSTGPLAPGLQTGRPSRTTTRRSAGPTCSSRALRDRALRRQHDGDPTNPYTAGYYDTFDGPHNMGTLGRGGGGGNYTRPVYDGRSGSTFEMRTDSLSSATSRPASGLSGWMALRVERPRLGDAEQLERVGLEQRARQSAKTHIRVVRPSRTAPRKSEVTPGGRPCRRDTCRS